MDDDEVPAADQTKMGDRRQRARRDRVVRAFHAVRLKPEALGKPRQGQKIRPAAFG
jgi:hypothetical protein